MGVTFPERIRATAWKTFDDQALLAVEFLEVGNVPGPTAAEVRALFRDNSMKAPKNMSQHLSSLVSLGLLEAINDPPSPRRFRRSFTGSGRTALLRDARPTPGAKPYGLSKLKVEVAKVADALERDYVTEAIKCYEAGCLRATVVLCWAAAMQRLHVLLERKGIAQFEQAYRARYPQSKVKTATRVEDLRYFDDSQLLQVGEDLGLLDRNERTNLVDQCLKLRNQCGHPGAYKPGTSRVDAFVEDLIAILLSRP